MSLAWVFVYGSNLDLSDLARWHRLSAIAPGHRARAVPVGLSDHRLVWHFYSRTRRSGAADVQPEVGASVYGLALSVDEIALRAFDLKEGHPQLYRRTLLPVSGWRAPGFVCYAWVYRVEAEHRSTQLVAPAAGYLGFLLSAAERYDFPTAYVQQLEAAPVMAPRSDPTPACTKTPTQNGGAREGAHGRG